MSSPANLKALEATLLEVFGQDLAAFHRALAAIEPIRSLDLHLPQNASPVEILHQAVALLDRWKLLDDASTWIRLVDEAPSYSDELLDLAARWGHQADSLPVPAPRSLPATPFKDLAPFTEADAHIFFGRRRPIQTIRRVLRDPRPRVVLVFGPTGVGKSSLLQAGVLTRLGPELRGLYVQHTTSASLRDNLGRALGDPDLLGAWRAREARHGKPEIVVFDQIESAYATPEGDSRGDRELEELLSALLDESGALNVRGKLVLGVRKEWLADVLRPFDARGVAPTRYEVPRLDFHNIREIIRGPTRRDMREAYRLSFEDGVEVQIAGDLIEDAQSPIAPTLQILLTQLWREATLTDSGRRITQRQYRELGRKEVRFKAHIQQRLRALAEVPGLRAGVEAGLALDLLFECTTKARTARSLPEAELVRSYGPDIRGLIDACIEARLLRRDEDENAPTHVTLTHDAVAPVVRLLFRESTLPGQRARRLLARLTEAYNDTAAAQATIPQVAATDLETLERGRPGMRQLEELEARIIADNRRRLDDEQERERRAAQELAEAQARELRAAQELAEAQAQQLKTAQELAATRAREVGQAQELAEARRKQIETAQELATKTAQDAELELKRARRFVRRASLVALAAVLLVLAVLWQYSTAQDAAIHARDQTRMVAIREAASDPTTQAILLREVERPATTRRWQQVAADVRLHATALAVLEHEGPLINGSFSPDGSRVVTASADKTARVWRADGSGEPVVLRHERVVRSAAFSPDGGRVVTASEDGTARVWRLDDADEPIVLDHVGNTVWSAAFSPDGGRIATRAADDRLRVWQSDGSDMTVVAERFWLAWFSPDLTQTALLNWIGPEGVMNRPMQATLRRTDGSGLPVTLSGHASDATISFVSFSPDGSRVLTGSTDGAARVWPSDGNGPAVVLDHAGQWVDEGSFSRDGTRIVTASYPSEYVAWVWPADGNGRPRRLEGHTSRINALEISPDNRLVVTASDDNTARLWRSDGVIDEPVVLLGHTRAVQHAAFSPDGTKIVTISEDGTARIWRTGATDDTPTFHGDVENSSPDWFSLDGSRVVTLCSDHTARVWRVDGAGDVLVLRHPSMLRSATFSPDGHRLVTTSDDDLARVWQLDGTSEPVALRHETSVHSASFSPGGRWVVTTTASPIARVWRTDGSETATELLHGARVRSARFSPDAMRVVTTSDDHTARVWRADGSGEPVLLPHSTGVTSAQFSQDGSRILTVAADIVRVWPADGAGEPQVFDHEQYPVVWAAFSPDGSRVATVTDYDHFARVWPTNGEGRPVLLKGHTDYVNTAIFSADGSRVVTASDDRTVRVWQANGTGEPLTLSGAREKVQSAAFSSDGRRIFMALKGGSVRIWNARPFEEQVADLWRGTTHCLSEAQRIARLGETDDEARSNAEACRARVAEYAAQGAYR